ncbi:signal transduction histidine kinase [Actinoalloteichus hoggarensis]|uniref:Redox sensor histidine kinase response regulator DevS n=1 Tax=Actinoalloteichus hoggarensis TaxID=1470176 RepID=A0A221W1F8_9PSEU|nr:GAF domain-containing sensor histidine kinase [Actinoalloteichus hoggarensis]ASO19612.1 Redox sensor histidine kinase response regulator DevS [Actinoalloteichus hoggarensis]MBB5919681.1 signal transduction histidine kinase [Actinoalloteichus hoggarensis]
MSVTPPTPPADQAEVSVGTGRSGGPADRALVEAVLAVAAGADLESTLRQILRSALELVGADCGAFTAAGADRPGDSVYVGIDAPGWHRLTHSVPPVPVGKATRHPGTEDDESRQAASMLAVPVGVRAEVYGSLTLVGKSGGFTRGDEELLTGLASAAGIAVADARLVEEERDQRRWAAVEGEITTELIAGACTEDAFDLLARRSLESTEADLALVLLTERDSPTLMVVGAAGAAAGRPAERVDRAALLSTAEPASGGATVLGAADLAATTALGRIAGGLSLGSAVVVPLGGVVEPTGALLVARAARRAPLPVGRIPAMAAFADQVSLTLQLVERQRTRRELDLLADRERIARELHDQVIQRLFAIGLALQRTVARNADPLVSERIHEVLDALDETVREIRTSIFDLHAEAGGEAGPRRRLADVVSELTRDTTLSAVVRTSGPVDALVPAALAGHAEAVVREAVTNVVRHAEARRVTVTVEVTDHLLIDVLDDGIGLPDDVARSGLRNLAERATEAGGSLVVAAARPHGTRLSWRAPLRGAAPRRRD